MDAKLAFWTWAFAALSVAVGCGLVGVRRVRAGRVRSHRRMMTAAALAIAAFLVSYLLKVALLGREDRAVWSAFDLGVLYVHEVCVLVMLLAGGYAGFQAWRFRASLGGGELPVVGSSAAGRVRHRIGGRVAVVSGVFALLTAGIVLAGMYARSG